jgi:hypothetical protein
MTYVGLPLITNSNGGMSADSYPRAHETQTPAAKCRQVATPVEQKQIDWLAQLLSLGNSRTKSGMKNACVTTFS